MVLIKIESLSRKELEHIALQEGVAQAPEMSRDELIDVLKDIYATWHGKGLEIYQVAIATDKPSWERVISAQGLEWINVCDGLGEASPVIGMYNLRKLPAYYLIVDGQLSDKTITDAASLKKALAEVL